MDERITREVYKKTRNQLLESISVICGLALLFCSPAIILTVVAFMTLSGSDSSEFVAVLIFCAGIVWCAMVCYAVHKIIEKKCKDLGNIKAEYLKNRTECESRKDNKIKRINITLGIVFVVIIFILPIVKWDIANSKAEGIYIQAEELVWDKKEYENAIGLLESIEIEYKDKTALIAYCQAKVALSENRVSSAYFRIDDIKFTNLSEKQLQEVELFKNELKVTYDKYIEERYSNNYTVVYESTTRYEPTTKYIPSYNNNSYDDDPYDIDRYRNEEDFYYDNYENFIDYYDAEKYFKEHKKDN